MKKRVFASSIFFVFISIAFVFESSKSIEDAYTRLIEGNKRFVNGNVMQKDISDEKKMELTEAQHLFNMKKRVFALSIFFVFVSIAFVFGSSKNIEDAYTRLIEGNKRFVNGNVIQKDISDERRKELTKGQHPFAIVLTCSDARIAPEIIFDQGLGELFVVRTAGNVVDSVALGSIEYAAEYLNVPLLVVLGHTQCGAVTASLEAKGKPEGNIGSITKKILPAVKKAKSKGGNKDEILSNAIKENVLLVEKDIIKNSHVLKHLIEKNELKVVCAIYDLSSGKVEVLK